MNITKYGNMAIRGVIEQFAPSMAQGFIVELLQEKKITATIVMEWVRENRSLWENLEPHEQ